ncbi:MAG: stage V sporulation protein AA [Lachnospiraceae bacterium]|nr:stage V sporulation protein AA [Lachnospiraceae bacterium]MCR5701124.1 stage V sporulation protein AA [Lachnospiraceae bacterium]
MSEILYIKASDCSEVEYPNVILSDFLTIYSNDKKLENEIKGLHFYTFPRAGQIAVSIMKIVELINEKHPNIDIKFLGEEDFIIEYHITDKYEKLKENLATCFICLVAFFGGGYAIMSYNTDVGAKELFMYLSMLFLGNSKQGVMILSICYSLGLTLGMVLFFNHIGNKKLNKDPTPLEIQMRLFEKDLDTTIIKNADRHNEILDVE